GRFFVAIDERFQVQSRQVAIADGVGANAIEWRLCENAEALEIVLLRVGKAIAVLADDGLEASVGFGLALRRKFGCIGRTLEGLRRFGSDCSAEGRAPIQIG